MPSYLLIVQTDAGDIRRVIQAADDADARDATLDELLLRCDFEVICASRARLVRGDGSDVWPPDLVGNLVG